LAQGGGDKGEMSYTQLAYGQCGPPFGRADVLSRDRHQGGHRHNGTRWNMMPLLL